MAVGVDENKSLLFVRNNISLNVKVLFFSYTNIE